MRKKNKSSEKGFSLIELLGVVTLIGILAIIAVPTIFTHIQNSKDKTFMINVQGVVNKIKETKAVSDIKCCVLSDLLGDSDEFKAQNIKTLDIIVYQDENNKTKYAVNATSGDEKSITMTADFDTLTINDKKEWDKGVEELTKLTTDYFAKALSNEESFKEDVKLCDEILEEIK